MFNQLKTEKTESTLWFLLHYTPTRFVLINSSSSTYMYPSVYMCADYNYLINTKPIVV
jgi:hypothetical protein